MLLLVILPGENYYQTLTLSPQSPKLQTLPVSLPPLPKVPIITSTSDPPQLTAKAVFVYDPQSSAVLYQLNPDSRLLPASTTKIMTALVALDEYDLDDIVTVTNANQSIGHRAQLHAGERLYVKDLLKALMISSGNDAALALAQHHPLGYQEFINLMNQKADKLQLNNTHYANVSGVETLGHYSSVHDLALLTQEAMKNDFFTSVVNTQSTSITDITGTIAHQLVNINQLLGTVEGVQGVKTGWTQNAGECLVTYTNRQGNPLIVVVLGSLDRFGESQQLIEWAYQNHTWISTEDLLQNLGY